MRICFMGTPEFAVPALNALHQAAHRIVAVYSQPPRPSGRGLAARPSPVQQLAEKLGAPVWTPVSFKRDPNAISHFAALDVDVVVVAAYGLILPPAVLNAPRLGCLNIHASLLPRWRGAGPIQAAILAGDAETGVTIMKMEAGLDTGPMVVRQAVPITTRTTAASLHDQLSVLGARLITQTLAAEAPFPAIPQPETGVTYAPKLTREHGHIDWRQSAAQIDCQIRALNPWPGTFAMWQGAPLKILTAEPEPISTFDRSEPGTVLDATNELRVACGDGVLRVQTLQRPGRAAMAAAVFLRGTTIPPGTVLT